MFSFPHSLSRYYRRAAEQGCVPCLLELGDAHYNGVGTEVSGEKAAGIYQAAVKQKSAQAMFNLGVMYEYGLGIEQDMHMSKRYYDMALSTDPVWILYRGNSDQGSIHAITIMITITLSSKIHLYLRLFSVTFHLKTGCLFPFDYCSPRPQAAPDLPPLFQRARKRSLGRTRILARIGVPTGQVWRSQHDVWWASGRCWQQDSASLGKHTENNELSSCQLSCL